MAAEGIDQTLTPVVALLAAGVVAVPLFRRIGLGSVLGYFAAGLAIGPFGLRLFTEPEAMLHVSELGVVMFLFIIGLEMQPKRLWSLRREIFGLGLAQVVVCATLLTGAAVAVGFPPLAAFVAGAGFVLSSTAVVMQILQERGESATAHGQQAISILLLEDLSIVPLLAIVAFLAPAPADGAASAAWVSVGIGLAGLAGLIAAGLFLLDPMFALLARSKTREVMTAGALLVVLGAAYLMDLVGLSMAMGAFIAGVLLSGSSYRHQIEADVEPFKGILLGLFFLSVGMSLDLGAVARDLWTIVALLAALMAVKALGVFAVARVFGASNRTAAGRVALFVQGGEFAFVLYAAAFAGGLIDARQNAIFSTTIILSMALTPVIMLLADRFLKPEAQSADGLDVAENLHGSALLIGFGRFGQLASQALLARGVEVATIDNDPNRIREAGRFGFKVYFGDGTQLNVLKASGAEEAAVILVCVDDREAANHIVALAQAEFPHAKLLVRSYDRRHSIELIRAGVAYEVRETVESALALSGAALRELGVDPVEANELVDDIRRRDRDRLALQMAGGITAGKGMMHTTPVQPTPEPLTQPKRFEPERPVPAE